ncbi:hypothetical protein FFLO_05492 [Filobasidium floriforme]|uniref:Uncharacterized protein n=1 Tax=Filobasidium floriforme TaxID=5210 RepID=A0A8K0JIG2_9TREE|nr:hypothetical protein FFLO_05492 [Filobasidium floriforme]
MTKKLDDQDKQDAIKIILTAFNTTGNWAAYDVASTLHGLVSADVKGSSNNGGRDLHIETVILPPTYEGISTKVAELHADDNWDFLIHVSPGHGSSNESRIPKGAERMGYDELDAGGQFAPMINPLRGTRGLEGKGRKWHTTVDVDGLVRHLTQTRGHQALSSCDNPGLGGTGFAYASSLKASSKNGDGVRPVLCFLSPGTDNVEPSGSASQTKEILLDICDWLASNTSKGKSQ